MNRRELLQGSAALTAASFALLADAAEKPASGHGMHEHHHGGSPYAGLAHAATHCVMFGEACVGHCLDLLGNGPAEMAECAKSVEQMMAVCNSLRQLSTWNSRYVPRLAKVAMDVCRDCERACRKHEKEHEACRKCAEACAACHDECAKVAA